MRISIALIVMALFVVPLAAEAPVVVVRLTSVNSALDDIEMLADFEDPEAERERFLRELVEPLSLPLGEWLDRNRPVMLTASMSGFNGSATDAVVAFLPVLNNADALAALGGNAEDVPEDGVHELERADGKHWYVLSEDHYLTVGLQRAQVVGFERDKLEGLDFSRGNIAVEVNMETVTPMLQGLIGMQRQQMRQAMEQAKALEEEQGTAPDSEGQAPSPEAMVGITDFYFDNALTVLRNVARFQLSLDRAGDEAIVRARVVPTADSALEELIAEQPIGFSKLSRAVPAEPALVSYAAHYRMTDELREGLMVFMDQYLGVTEQAAGIVPGMEWVTQVMSDQQEASKQRLACIGGDAAGSWDMGGEEGYRGIQLSSIPDSPECESLTEQEIEAMAQLRGPDGDPLVTASEPNVAPGEVRATRIEVHMDRLVQGDEAATQLMESMFGANGPVSFYGQTDTATISVTGPGAEERFADVVDRLQSRRKRGGLTEEIFAPLQAGAGFFAVIDPSRFDLEAMVTATMPDGEQGEQEEDEAEPEEEEDSGRIVVGAYAERGRLAIDVALPGSMLRSWFEGDAGHGPPADLWPPPPAPVAVPKEPAKGEAAAADTVADPIALAGTDGVTLPELKQKIAPDYPEIMREHRLEGRIILQAVIDKQGAVKQTEVLNCSGQSMNESSPRENLLLASKFCTTFSDAAAAAVERWRYEPARRDDEAVDVYFTVRVDFELE